MESNQLAENKEEILKGYGQLLRAIFGENWGKKPKPPSDAPRRVSDKAKPEYIPFLRYKLDEVGKESELKVDVLNLMDEGKADTIASAARQLKVRPSFLYQLMREDPDWGGRVRQCRETFADRLEEEILGADLKYPQVLARMFMLKGLRPSVYRDNYKIVVGNPKVEQLLTELQRLGHPAQAKMLTEGEAGESEITPLEEIAES